MPKDRSTEDLPESVRKVLPKHAQEIYQEAHNNALEQYKDPGSAEATLLWRRPPTSGLGRGKRKICEG